MRTPWTSLRFNLPVLLSFLPIAALTGCAGLVGTAVDDVPAATTMGPISGSNFGGHAPIVGAHIYVLQAGTSGYGGMSTSLLTTGGAQYPVTANVNDPNVPAGWNYVTSDNSGNFNITGDYTCSPGLAVYIYAYGGTAAIAPSSFVTSYSVSGTTVTLQTTALLSNGQTVGFNGFQNTGVSGLDTGSFTVQNATTTSFQVTLAGATGSGTVSNATVTPKLVSNPNIVNMAVLGNCPTSGNKNFSSLSFVYMNEVSTVAAAYSLSGFFSNSSTSLASTDAVHLSIPAEAGQAGVSPGTSPAWLGIENAALNAAVLYDIQGSVVGTSGDGETHIANSSTTAAPSNGVVPQALINTMADALATCVDSNSTATTTSVACTTLFGYLGSTVGAGGVPSGTAPTDTATAAIDMAHNPGNSHASAILGLASGVVPFTPTVVAADSTDLLIGITWPVPVAEQSGALVYNGATDYFGSTAADAKGNVWAGSYLTLSNNEGYLMEYDHLGNQKLAKQVSYSPSLVGLDTNNNLWILPNDYVASGPTTPLGIYEYTAASNYNTVNYLNQNLLDNAESFVIDGNNNIYITAYQSQETIKINSAGVLQCSYSSNGNAPFGVGLDGSSNVWIAAYGYNLQEWMPSNCNTNNRNGANFSSNQTIGSPQTVAADASGNVWVSDRTQNAGTPKPINKIVPGTSTQAAYAGGGLSTQGATALAVDGSGHVIVGSWTSPNLLTILDGNTGNFLTTSNGLTGNYQVTGSGTTTVTTEGFWFFTIDGSGNLWSNGSANLHEYIGIATPVLTPLSLAVKAGQPASRP